MYAQENTSKPTVLVIEDDTEMIYILNFILEKEGFKVYSSADGEEAISALKNGPVTDIILLDMVLPFKNGIQILQELKSFEKWQKTPVIMLSSKDDEQDIVTGIENGANDYITKPFSPQELMSRLRRHLTVNE